MSNPYQSPQHADEPPPEEPARAEAEPPPLPAYSFRGLLWTHLAMTVISFGVGQCERISFFRPLFYLIPVMLASVFVMPLIVLIRCLISGPGHRAIALFATLFMAYASVVAILPLVQ